VTAESVTFKLVFKFSTGTVIFVYSTGKQH